MGETDGEPKETNPSRKKRGEKVVRRKQGLQKPSSSTGSQRYFLIPLTQTLVKSHHLVVVVAKRKIRQVKWFYSIFLSVSFILSDSPKGFDKSAVEKKVWLVIVIRQECVQ